MRSILKIDDGFVDIGSNSLYYKSIGSGEPILVLHGGPGLDHQHLLPYIEKLGNKYNVILYDQRGSGRSKGPVNSTTINMRNFIEDIEVLRRFFNIKKLNLLGGSWGGILAMFYSIKYPRKLNSLILNSTFGSSDFFQSVIKCKRTPDDVKLLESIEQSEDYKQKDPKSMEDYFRVYFKAHFVDQSLVSKINLTVTKRTAENYYKVTNYIWESIGNFNLHESLKVIQCPTLVIHGLFDSTPIEAAYKIHESIDNSELKIFTKSGHWIFIEEEQKFNLVVGEFLSRAIN